MHPAQTKLLNLLVGRGYRITAGFQLDVAIHIQCFEPESSGHLDYACHLERVAFIIENGQVLIRELVPSNSGEPGTSTEAGATRPDKRRTAGGWCAECGEGEVGQTHFVHKQSCREGVALDEADGPEE